MLKLKLNYITKTYTGGELVTALSEVSLGFREDEFEVSIGKLKAKFKEKFGSEDLQLETCTVLIHGVQETVELPDTVLGTVKGYGPHTTLPIVVGEIEEV